MPIIKPSFDGSDAESGFYNGPPPTPGPYKGAIKKLWLAKIKSGENEGADKIVVSVEISNGKFKGAEILHNLTVLKNSAWSLNQFLDSMTDGSEKQKTILRKWFWTIGYAVDDEEDKIGRKITRIGKKFDPIGKPVSFIVKKDEWDGKPVAKIDRFVVPLEDSGEEGAEDEDDGLGETSDSSEPEETEDDSPPAEDSADDDDDSDDPWS